jgi:hypothetical protein
MRPKMVDDLSQLLRSMMSSSLSRCLNFERLKFAAHADSVCTLNLDASGASVMRRISISIPAPSRRNRIAMLTWPHLQFDRAPLRRSAHNTSREREPRRCRSVREVEGASGVCYSIWLGAWRSLVAHLPWEQGVGRSNRLAPTSRQ